MGKIVCPPEGFLDVEPSLREFAARMREVEVDGSTRIGAVFRINHQRSRYIYDLYYKRNAISKELYDYLLANHYADGALIAKWKKPGFENLCCLRCMQPRETNFGTTCVCRVPRKQLDTSQNITCYFCGCHGCCG